MDNEPISLTIEQHAKASRMVSETIHRARMRDSGGVLMSVRPQYADAILDGDKTVEFRRKVPARWRAHGTNHNKLWLYATRPVSAVVGFAITMNLMESSPADLWKCCGHRGKISHDEFMAYFAGADWGFAIWLWEPVRVEPITLASLRERKPGFNPPQAWHLNFMPHT